MEKRFVLFIVLSVGIMMAYMAIKLAIAPPPQPADVDPVAQADPAAEDQDPQADKADDSNAPDGSKQPAGDGPPDADPNDTAAAETAVEDPNPADNTPPDTPPAIQAVEQISLERITLGSFDPDRPEQLLVTLINRSGGVECVELVQRNGDQLRFGALNDESGYLGYLALQPSPDAAGVVVQVVGAGTPAALAEPADSGQPTGLQVGDVIVGIDDQAIADRIQFDQILSNTEPDQKIQLTVRRGEGAQAERLRYTATLAQQPMKLISPEADSNGDVALSYRMTLHQFGDRILTSDAEELPGLSMYEDNWKIIDRGPDHVAFSYTISEQMSEKLGGSGSVEIIKRFRLAKAEADDESAAAGFHLALQIEVRNLGTQPIDLAWVLDGPNGLPTEGWWYEYKIHPSWGSAGTRDVIWRLANDSHRLRSATQIYKSAKDNASIATMSVLPDQPSIEDRTLDYLGLDTQYFAAVLIPGTLAERAVFACKQAYAIPVGSFGELDGREMKKLNTTFRLVSLPQQVAPGEDSAWVQPFTVFLGPKDHQVLAAYQLNDIIEYGWFGWVAKPLSRMLHLFYFVFRNYGIAIVMLTVLVRGAMFPLGRKAARNAQMMQELAPEIRQINEKYKNDLEKRTQATRELWAKHNFNPLGGCWLMFLQLPIFMGLYRALSTDIELREAPLIPGISWCSNLAGPDMFLNWNTGALQFLTGETGWLGPYLNILPIVTIFLFLLQQKMFTPPATDEQTRMQQKMMKYMMIFFGVLFFKVPSGLCIYFIASSLWGIGERKLLPKPDTKKNDDDDDKPAPKSLLDRFRPKEEINGAEKRKQRQKSRQRKRP